MGASQEQAVRELAYQKWLDAGAPAGSDGVEFWVQAEAEIKQKSQTCSKGESDEDEE
jgi:hypothetical protein